MALTSLAIVMAVPMQLAGAAAIETTVGYDTTVLNPTTQCYGNGGVARGAFDLQLGHQGSTVRQLLRNRTEFLYSGGEGRSFSDSDFLNLARYAMLWEPDDGFNSTLELNYSVGRSSLLLGRAGIPAQSFQPGVYSDLTARWELNKTFSDTWRGSLEFGNAWRYAVSLPPAQARNNSLAFNTLATVTHDFNDSNLGTLNTRAEYFLVDGFPDWVLRLTNFAGYTRNWSENTITALNAGIDALQDQNNTSRFSLGPYATAGITQLFPDAHLAFGLNARHEFGLISGSRCAVAAVNGVCPMGRVVAGGTGLIDSATFSGIWQSEEGMWTLSADVTGERGVTQNLVQTTVTGARQASADVVTINVTSTAGLRWQVSRAVSFFTRYNFLLQRVDTQDTGDVAPAGLCNVTTDIIRHLVLVGATFALISGDGPLEGIAPLEELTAIQNARSAQHSNDSEGAGGAAGGAGGAGGDNAFASDPFDLQNEEAESTNSTAPGAPGPPGSSTGSSNGTTEDTDTNDTQSEPQGEQNR